MNILQVEKQHEETVRRLSEIKLNLEQLQAHRTFIAELKTMLGIKGSVIKS